MEKDVKRWRNKMTLLLMIFLTGCTPALTATPAKIEARQAIVVKSADWKASTAVLQAYEKDKGSFWVSVGKKIPVALGRNGLGWGIGIYGGMGLNSVGPIKKEGDGRSPAGVFSLGSVFGYDPAERMSWVRIPYQQASADHRCVDDVHSVYYNRVVDAGRVKPDWSSSEAMLRQDDLYRLTVRVDHNANPVTSGSGSCIFMHIWEGPGIGTSGCTAMDSEDLEMLILWMVPESQPVLIQLPEKEYEMMRESWGFP